MKDERFSINELYEEIAKITDNLASYLLTGVNGFNVCDEKIIDKQDYDRILQSIWIEEVK